MPQGKIFKINALGLENSIRKSYDGFTYFGYQEENENNENVFIYIFFLI